MSASTTTMLGRWHLFEFVEQQWLPPTIRNTITALLAHQVKSMQVYDSVLPKLTDAIRSSGRRSIVDLCAGGLTSLDLFRRVEHELGDRLEVRLTDKFPNRERFEELQQEAGPVQFERESVDALRVPRRLSGFRTLFTAFHHFTPSECRSILRDAIAVGEPIAVFEFTERSVPMLVLGSLLGIPVVLVSCATLRQMTAARFFWTFVVPVVPLLFYWDGFVSALRSYQPQELRRMVREVAGSESYDWDIGRTERKHPMAPRVTYLIGLPRVSNK